MERTTHIQLDDIQERVQKIEKTLYELYDLLTEEETINELGEEERDKELEELDKEYAITTEEMDKKEKERLIKEDIQEER